MAGIVQVHGVDDTRIEYWEARRRGPRVALDSPQVPSP
jgi:hypothetical protein